MRGKVLQGNEYYGGSATSCLQRKFAKTYVPLWKVAISNDFYASAGNCFFTKLLRSDATLKTTSGLFFLVLGYYLEKFFLTMEKKVEVVSIFFFMLFQA